MALDSSTDIPLHAIAALLRVAIKVDVGADALIGIYEDPSDLLTIGTSKLPSLAVYRGKERRKLRESGKTAQLITVFFDYVIPATGAGEPRAQRWPVLQRVWNEIVDSVIAGHHSQIESDADVLGNAGITVNLESPTAEYGFASHGGQSYPIARGRIEIEYFPTSINNPDTPAAQQLYKFLSMHASYTLPGADQDTQSLPGTTTGAGPVETNLEGHPSGLE